MKALKLLGTRYQTGSGGWQDLGGATVFRCVSVTNNVSILDVANESGGVYTVVARYAIGQNESVNIRKEAGQYINGNSSTYCFPVAVEG